MEHLHRLSIELEPSEALSLTNARANSLGPFLQGALMEHVNPDYAAMLHHLAFNPYSTRCLLEREGKIRWEICTLTDEAYHELLVPLIEVETMHLKSLDRDFTVAGRNLEERETSYLTNLIDSGGPLKAKVRFVTPTAFKSGGSYVFLPTLRLIFQNLLMHYFYVYEGSGEVDEETVQYIDSHTRITSYNLHSQYFDHAIGKGRKVPAFVGTLGVSIKGPQQLEGLCKMLLAFGEYAGVGIKTSMGMGGLQCL